LAFYLVVTAVMCSRYNEDLVKTIMDLTQNVKSMQDELTTLKKRGSTQSGINDPLTLSSSQYSDIIVNDNPPLNKKHMADDQDEQASDDELDDLDNSTLVPLSEEAATFLEAAFNTKLDNMARRGKAKAQGTLDS